MKRANIHLKQLNKEDGVTLVELLAAITILSIIVTAFLAYFVQAGNTNNRTDRVNEATFLAQEEMENVIYYHQGNSLNTYETSKDYADRRLKNGFEIKTEIAVSEINDTEIKMYQVIVTVDERGGKGHAQMETWLPLKEDIVIPTDPEE